MKKLLVSLLALLIASSAKDGKTDLCYLTEE